MQCSDSLYSRGLLILSALLSGIGTFGCHGLDSGTAENGEKDVVADSVPATLTLNGDLRHVHDPAIIQARGDYYLFSTGGGIQWRSSANRTSCSHRGDVLGGVPEWAEQITEGDLWAPDITFFDDEYHLYYSASPFGSGRSAIGVATNPVLSPDSSEYEWTDEGMVIESYNSDPYNAIDPAIIIDKRGRLWMVFGSWNDTGVRMRRLNPETGKPSDEDETFYSLANRPDADENAIEAPYIIHRDNYYYVFVSFDKCCRGVGSTCNIRVGRSETVTGPYVDKRGTQMTEGGRDARTTRLVRLEGTRAQCCNTGRRRHLSRLPCVLGCTRRHGLSSDVPTGVD